MRLKDKIALVTGAGQGIGKGIAVRFAREGADVIINDVSRENAESVAEEIRKLGRKSIAVVADISKKSEVDKMAQKVFFEFKSVDILVNNAGISRIVPFWDMTEEIWDKVININLKGTFLCCLVFVPHMIERRGTRRAPEGSGSGKIINMSSKSGKIGNTAFAAYCASKSGIIGFTQSLALDLAQFNINVNAICPGIVFTPHWDELEKQYAKKRNMPVEDVRKYLEGKIPLGRAQTVEDVANIAVFLASDQSDYMTGQAINITGGQEMR